MLNFETEWGFLTSSVNPETLQHLVEYKKFLKDKEGSQKI